jgi:hypothetical protein
VLKPTGEGKSGVGTLQAMALYNIHIYLNEFYVYVWLWQPQIIRKWKWKVEIIVVVLCVDYGLHHAKYNRNIPRDRSLFPVYNTLTPTITVL